MRGFTLPEVLVALAVLGVLLAVGIPAFATLRGNAAIAADRQQLVSMLGLARNAAVTHGARATLCPLAPGEAVPACSGAYSRGWLLYLDRSGDGSFRVDDDTVLRVHASDPGVRVLDRKGQPFRGSATYRPDGSAARPLTLLICHGLTARIQRVVMSMTGRVRTVSETGSCPS